MLYVDDHRPAVMMLYFRSKDQLVLKGNGPAWEDGANSMNMLNLGTQEMPL